MDAGPMTGTYSLRHLLQSPVATKLSLNKPYKFIKPLHHFTYKYIIENKYPEVKSHEM